MQGREVIAPSKRQRWGATLVALVVAGVVVTRGGTPESIQAESSQAWSEISEIDVAAPVQWPESETSDVDDNDSSAALRSK